MPQLDSGNPVEANSSNAIQLDNDFSHVVNGILTPLN